MNNQTTQSMYDDQKVVSQYMEFHYGDAYFNVPNYPRACAEHCIKVCKENNVATKSALDLGCAVGRSSFELASAFDKVTGVDLSSGLISAAKKIQSEGDYPIAIPMEGDLVEKKTLSLKQLGLAETLPKVTFAVEDAGKLDIANYNSYDLIFCGNLIDRMSDPIDFLQEYPQIP